MAPRGQGKFGSLPFLDPDTNALIVEFTSWYGTNPAIPESLLT